MKRKQYIRPSQKIIKIKMRHILCASIQGVKGTRNLDTDLYDDEETDDYL